MQQAKYNRQQSTQRVCLLVILEILPDVLFVRNCELFSVFYFRSTCTDKNDQIENLVELLNYIRKVSLVLNCATLLEQFLEALQPSTY